MLAIQRAWAVALVLCSLQARVVGQTTREDPPSEAANSARFVENLGQWPGEVRFAAEIRGVVARAECEGLGFHAAAPDGEGAYVRLVFEGGARMPEPRGIRPLPGVHHYYIGNDPSRWRTNAHAYAAVEYRDIYPGVDLILRAEGPSAKYDLVLAPGVDPSVVRARWLGPHASAAGAGLALNIGSAAVHELPVVAWQTAADGSRRTAEVRWVVDLAGALRLDVQGLDTSLSLTVDPEIVWGTYLGGTAMPNGGTEGTQCVRLGPDDTTFAAGVTAIQSYPSTPGAYRHTPFGGRYITIARLRSDGSALYSAVLGGSGDPPFGAPGTSDVASISPDSLGRLLVTGPTESASFPTTPGAFDRIHDSTTSAFVFRLSSDGATLDFSTFLEGSSSGQTNGLDCHADADGSSLIVGGYSAATGAPDFPTTLPPIGPIPSPGPFQSYYGGFVARLSADGSGLEWSRIFGSRAGPWRVAVTRTGNVDLVGTVVLATLPTTPGSFMPVKPHPTNTILFAMQLPSDGSSLNWCTYLGSADASDQAIPGQLSLDDFDTLTFDFTTRSRDFPTTPDSFLPTPEPSPWSYYGGGITRLSADGSHLVGSTYTSNNSGGLGAPSCDRSGVVSAFGQPGSTFPATPGAADETPGPGSEVQIARFDPRLRRLLHLRHFGGPSPKFGTTAAVQPDRAVTVGGIVQNPGEMPTTPGAFQYAYPGAVTSGFAITLDLTVAGVTPVGAGTPACHGSIVTEAWRSPASGAADFGLYCSGAPENARGALLIGRRTAVPRTFGGATLHVDLAAGYRLLRVRTDEFGYLETPLPIPALQPGTAFTVQYVFQNHSACTGAGRYSSSNAARLVIQ